MRFPIALPLLAMAVAGAAWLCGPSAVSATPRGSWFGVTRPGTAVTLAPEQSGRIAKMPLREGELVQADRVVLELGHRIEELRVRRLRMQLESGTKTLEAKSRYEHALKERNRVQKMVEENVGRATDLTNAQLELDIRELALRQAELDESILRNELEQAEANLAQRFVRSPIDGIVEKRHFEEGETIERFQAAVEIVSLDPLNVDFDCPIALVDRFELGTEVQVQRDHDNTGSKRIGEVVHCAQQADPASHTLRIRIRLPNPAPHWRAGLKVWLSLENQ